MLALGLPFRSRYNGFLRRQGVRKTKTVYHAMRRLGLSLILLIGGCGGASLGGTSGGGCNGDGLGEETTGAASASLPDAFTGEPTLGETPDGGSAPDAAPPDEPIPAEMGAVEPEEPVVDPPPGETLSESAPEVDLALYPTSVDDPLAYPAFGPEYAPDLLSLYLDALAIGALGSGGGVNTYTYLEQLCIDGGAPESYCRRLYADDEYD